MATAARRHSPTRYSIQTLSVYDAIEVFPEMASGARAFDDILLTLSAEEITRKYPGMSVTVGRAAEAVRKADAVAREINLIQEEGPEYVELVNRHLSHVGDAASCALILHQAH